MDYRKRSGRLTAALIVTIALCSTSCRSSLTTSAEQRNETHTETTVREIHTTDSVYIRDSIYVREGADTVFLTRWRTVWRDRIVHDTVRERTTDTIRETRCVEKVVQVPTKGGSAGWAVALALMLLIVVYILIKTLLKR